MTYVIIKQKQKRVCSQVFFTALGDINQADFNEDGVTDIYYAIVLATNYRRRL
jgi:hypothetical protein